MTRGRGLDQDFSVSANHNFTFIWLHIKFFQSFLLNPHPGLIHVESLAYLIKEFTPVLKNSEVKQFDYDCS